MRKYAKKHGYIIAGEYIDDGISGTKYSQRDELQRMLADVEEGKIDLLIFTRLDRFFRSVLIYSFKTGHFLLDLPPNKWYSITIKKSTKEKKTMTIEKAMRTYRLPNPTTTEDLECRWSKVLNFGDRILLAGHYYNGAGKPSYFGAVYEHLDDDLSCEGTIGLAAVSEVEFEDDGHAIAWAMQQ